MKFKQMKKIEVFILTIPLVIAMGCSSSIKVIETADVYQTKSFGFSQAVVVDGLLFASGQVGWDVSYQLTGQHQFEDQVKQSFINVEKIVLAANGSIDKIILLRLYVRQLDSTKRDLVSNYIKKYFPGDYQPATTLLGVEMLARNDLMIEIEVIAKVNDKKYSNEK
jgi:2-iminobutanoate/2-iminopropanoate deaminase